MQFKISPAIPKIGTQYSYLSFQFSYNARIENFPIGNENKRVGGTFFSLPKTDYGPTLALSILRSTG